MQLNKSQFALFVADIIKGIKNYNYDVFYDIVSFNNSIQETENENTEKRFNWYIRENGTYLVDANNADFNKSVKEIFDNKQILELTFHKKTNANNYSVVTINNPKQ